MPQTRLVDIKVRRMPSQGTPKSTVRVFDRSTSVFAGWEEDTEQSLRYAATKDMESWKVPKICIDESEYERVV